MNENFINFHILISHSPSCLNRDDMNMQKSAFFRRQATGAGFQSKSKKNYANQRLLPPAFG